MTHKVDLKSNDGSAGIKLMGTNAPVELEVMRRKDRSATFSISVFDNESQSNTNVIHLTKNQVADLLKLLTPGIQKIKP